MIPGQGPLRNYPGPRSPIPNKKRVSPAKRKLHPAMEKVVKTERRNKVEYLKLM
jgi:hypothetical protein